MPRCAVLGSPIAHSLSPVMHRTAYATLGLSDWTYDAFDVTEDRLPGFIAELDASWRGLSLTMPLKRAALPLLDDLSPMARTISSVNTVIVQDGALLGHNTDAPGAVAALDERGVRTRRRVRIIGAGATAASVLAALGSTGTERVELVARDPRRADETLRVARAYGIDVDVTLLGGSFDARTLAPVDLLVSTVPAAFFGTSASQYVGPVGAVFDVLYDPWPTPLARAAKAAGVPLVSGLDLLTHQAALQVELMTGHVVGADVLRTAAQAELEH